MRLDRISKCLHTRLSLGVADFAGIIIYGAWEFTAEMEVDVYVKLSLLNIEFHLFNLIWEVQSQGGCEKLVLVVHFTFISILFEWDESNLQALRIILLSYHSEEPLKIYYKLLIFIELMIKSIKK